MPQPELLATGMNDRSTRKQRIALLRPPFFTPMTPPLGIGLLKAFLGSHGHDVLCVDYDVHPDLWMTHHRYFALLTSRDTHNLNDGYSKLWALLSAHTQAYLGGADEHGCGRVLRPLAALYDIGLDESLVPRLHQLITTFFKRLADLSDGLDLSGYQFVGTSTYSTSLAASLFLLRRFKQRYPAIRTVMGGGVFADDLGLGSANLDVLLNRYDFVDHIVLGEGEMLLLRLMDGTLAHKRLVTLADLDRETLNVNDVPIPDFGDFALDNYLHLTIEGGRSCPFQCSFCSETIQWGDYRKKHKEVLAGQMTTMAERYGNRTFFMGDSLMNPYIHGLAAELLARNGRVRYDGYLRADKGVALTDAAAGWARSGLFRARLGLETASPRLLEVIDKKTTPAAMSAALRSLATAGIRPTTYWIVGYQGETEQDFLETLAFIREHHRFIYELEAHPYYYYPYGQVSSRLYDSVPIHPAEIRDIVPFDTWEIVDANPSREERFSRLRRLSDLASSLGLPNIYTMQDRHAAEQRWMRLWATAAVAY